MGQNLKCQYFSFKVFKKIAIAGYLFNAIKNEKLCLMEKSYIHFPIKIRNKTNKYSSIYEYLFSHPYMTKHYLKCARHIRKEKRVGGTKNTSIH